MAIPLSGSEIPFQSQDRTPVLGIESSLFNIWGEVGYGNIEHASYRQRERERECVCVCEVKLGMVISSTPATDRERERESVCVCV